MPIKADRFTINSKQIEKYSDFTVNFDLNPITGFLARVTNEDSIKQSLKNILFTQRTERFYDPFFGSRLRALMFEPIDNVTSTELEREIRESIDANEPRISKVEVRIKPLPDENSYGCTIYFEIINIPEQQFTLNLVLKRVR